MQLLLDPYTHRLFLETLAVWSSALFLLLQLPLSPKADEKLRQAVETVTSPSQPGASQADYTVRLGEGPTDLPIMAVLAHTALVITVRILWL